MPNVKPWAVHMTGSDLWLSSKDVQITKTRRVWLRILYSMYMINQRLVQWPEILVTKIGRGHTWTNTYSLCSRIDVTLVYTFKPLNFEYYYYCKLKFTKRNDTGWSIIHFPYDLYFVYLLIYYLRSQWLNSYVKFCKNVEDAIYSGTKGVILQQ